MSTQQRCIAVIIGNIIGKEHEVIPSTKIITIKHCRVCLFFGGVGIDGGSGITKDMVDLD